MDIDAIRGGDDLIRDWEDEDSSVNADGVPRDLASVLVKNSDDAIDSLPTEGQRKDARKAIKDIGKDIVKGQYDEAATDITELGTTYGTSSTLFTSVVNELVKDVPQAVLDKIGLGAPAAPSFLSAALIKPQDVVLNWTDNATNANGYTIEYSKDPSFRTFTTITDNNPTDTHYRINGLDANTTYYFRIQAFNAGGSSAFSNEASVTTGMV